MSEKYAMCYCRKCAQILAHYGTRCLKCAPIQPPAALAKGEK